MITRRTIATSGRIIGRRRRRNVHGSFVVSRNSTQAGAGVHTLYCQDYYYDDSTTCPPRIRSPLSSSISFTASLPIQSFIFQQQRRGFASIQKVEDTKDSPTNKSTPPRLAKKNNKNLPDDAHAGDPPSSASKKDKSNTKHNKSKGESKKNRDNSSRIQLVQLQDLHSKETIRNRFAPVLQRHDVSRLKWISTLKNQLKNKKINRKNPASNNIYMTHTQSYLPKQSKDIKAAFWDLILVSNENNNNNNNSNGGGGAAANKPKPQQPRKQTKQPTKEHVALLQKVRQSAVEFPILWSVTRKRKMNLQNQENNNNKKDGKPYPWKRYLAERSDRLAAIHNAKSQDQQEKEARELAERLQESMPKARYDRLLAVLQDHIEACEQDRTLPTAVSPDNPKRKKRIQVLYNKIREPLKRYIHLVAADLGDFLYVTAEDDGTNSRGDIMSDPRITESSKAFDGLLDNFVDSFATIHELLLKEYQTNNRKLEENNDDNKESDDDEIESELNEELEEAVLESFQDVVSTGAEAAVSKSKKKKAAAKRKPRSYVLFEAINLQDFPPITSPRTPILPSTAPAFPDFPSNAPNERLVIIDNLPIDANENLLMDAYSRCGPIESIAVFNKKPHLDPGRRSVDSKKKIRNPSSQREPWRRPRTALYAMILFADVASAQTAASDPLRIFGMVLDRHLIRSYPSKDLTKLYLEDIAGVHDIGAIEYELSQILHPELYVCLDIDGDQRASSRRHNRKNENSTSNCIIQFQDFEAAYWSYLRLMEKLSLLEEEDCELQWMETPKDAMLYWTRKLNF
ncbi:unnamed protein product [Cylindrotheca closterium]|uniref:RRM domain-containing protein n=1 Tax=Cylindrotheca closterium TaxID=2856 RepID=A0AAD2JM52_9STRA|nr:unnamed protein product [Cylindrotheca closterium]